MGYFWAKQNIFQPSWRQQLCCVAFYCIIIIILFYPLSFIIYLPYINLSNIFKCKSHHITLLTTLSTFHFTRTHASAHCQSPQVSWGQPPYNPYLSRCWRALLASWSWPFSYTYPAYFQHRAALCFFYYTPWPLLGYLWICLSTLMISGLDNRHIASLLCWVFLPVM